MESAPRLTNKSHACVWTLACISEDSRDSPGACAYTECLLEIFDMNVRWNLVLRDKFYKFVSRELRDRTLEVRAEAIEDAAFGRNAARGTVT